MGAVISHLKERSHIERNLIEGHGQPNLTRTEPGGWILWSLFQVSSDLLLRVPHWLNPTGNQRGNSQMSAGQPSSSVFVERQTDAQHLLLFLVRSIPFCIGSLNVNQDSGCWWQKLNLMSFKQKKEKLEKGRGGVGFKEINAIGAHCFPHLCTLVSFVTKWGPALQQLGWHLYSSIIRQEMRFIFQRYRLKSWRRTLLRDVNEDLHKWGGKTFEMLILTKLIYKHNVILTKISHEFFGNMKNKV